MKLEDYSQQAITTLLGDHDTLDMDASLISQVFGLMGESGEVAEKFKKLIRDKQGKISDEDKQEIIKELMEQYQRETLDMLALPDDRAVNANDKIRYFQVLSGQLWEYRFLHRDVYHLVENNDDFRKIYPRFAGRVMQQGQKIYHAFVDAGLMQMTASEIEALIINIWIVLTNWTNFLYMSGHLSDSNHLDEKWMWQALRQMVFLEGPYLRGESRETYERLLDSFGSSELFASLSMVKAD